MATYTVPNGYDRHKHPEMVKVRDLTKPEVLALDNWNTHAEIIARDGTLRTVKINGKVKTWKRDPDRIEVPIKYGMYECATFRWLGDGLGNDIARMVKRLGETEASE